MNRIIGDSSSLLEAPLAYIKLKRLVPTTKPKSMLPAEMSVFLNRVSQFTEWCKKQRLLKFDKIAWFDTNSKWTDLASHSRTKILLPMLMMDEDTENMEEIPLWSIDEILTDYMERIDSLQKSWEDHLVDYKTAAPTVVRSFVCDKETRDYRTFVPCARHRGVPTLATLLGSLYYEDLDDMPDRGGSANISLMNLLCSSHPELSALFAVQSPRVCGVIKEQAQIKADRIIMLSFAHACLFYLMADRQILILLMRIWVRTKLELRQTMLSWFGWMANIDELLEYLQLACIIEDDRICLHLVHQFIIQCHRPRSFKVHEIAARCANLRVRTRSASITIMENQPAPYIPLSPKRQGSPRSAPSSSGRAGDRVSPWLGLGPYARTLYTALVKKSVNCIALLTEEYAMLYDTCRESGISMDQFDPELPSMALSELTDLMGYSDIYGYEPY